MIRISLGRNTRVFFTSDTHFGHSKLLTFYKTPFSSIEERDNLIIKNWNSVIEKEDVVFHMGDFSVACPTKRLVSIIYSLNGRIYLCEGSHDKDSIREGRRIFSGISDTYYLKYCGAEIFMSHFNHKVWPKSHYNSWQIHGHSHNGLDLYNEKEGKILDACIDGSNYTPLSFEQVASIMSTRPNNFNYVESRIGGRI